jgi:uncharacterized RDD family membrane protein YckC
MAHGSIADEHTRKEAPPGLRYAGLWARFVANMLDALVIMTFTIVCYGSVSSSKLLSVTLALPLMAAGLGYSVVLHAHGGQTLGKMLMRIRVVSTTGDTIAWREAWRRSSVEMLLGLMASASSLIAMTRLPDAGWGGSWLQLAEQLRPLEPVWSSWATAAVQVWVWSQLVVLLLNRERRALHDFIAGTVVIKDSY